MCRRLLQSKHFRAQTSVLYVHLTTAYTGIIGFTFFEKMPSFQTLEIAPFDSIFSFIDRRILVAFITPVVLLTVTTLIDTRLSISFVHMGI